MVAVLDRPAGADPHWDAKNPSPRSSNAPYKIYNIGNQQPVTLMRYIEVLEQCLGKKALKNLLPNQPGDILDTWADVDALAHDVGYRPKTPLEEGVRQFVEWYLGYYENT